MRKKQSALFLCIFLALNLALTQSLWAKELQVSPASYHWEGVEAGETIQMPASILIKNYSTKERAYHLRAQRPAQIGLSTEKGFDPIPDTDWVSFGEVLVKIPAGESKSVRMYVSIPAGEKFKKPWMFYVEVKEEVPRYGYLQGRPDMFALACYVKIYLWP